MAFCIKMYCRVMREAARPASREPKHPRGAGIGFRPTGRGSRATLETRRSANAREVLFGNRRASIAARTDRLSLLWGHQPLEHSEAWQRQVLSDKTYAQLEPPRHLQPVVRADARQR